MIQNNSSFSIPFVMCEQQTVLQTKWGNGFEWMMIREGNRVVLVVSVTELENKPCVVSTDSPFAAIVMEQLL